ncbi:MAG: hypothetical protein AAF417_18115 [Pseudomonadota bacterium]
MRSRQQLQQTQKQSQNANSDFDQQQQQLSNEWDIGSSNRSNFDNDDRMRLSPDTISSGQRVSSTSASTPSSSSSTESPFYFNIGSIDTFEKKLETIQEDLGFEPYDFVPVVCTKETSIISELIRHLPSILLLGVGILMLINALSQFGGISDGRS